MIAELDGYNLLQDRIEYKAPRATDCTPNRMELIYGVIVFRMALEHCIICAYCALEKYASSVQSCRECGAKTHFQHE